MNLDDIFGQMDLRPDHPDLWKLSQILLRQDADIVPGGDEESNEAAYKQRIHEAGIDDKVLAWCALQRAFRMTGVKTNADLIDPRKFMKAQELASAWIDGFVAASAYAKEYTLPERLSQIKVNEDKFKAWCIEKGYKDPDDMTSASRRFALIEYLQDGDEK